MPILHMSFHEVVNFFSTPIPHELEDQIISQLPVQSFAAIQEITSQAPDARLQPLVSLLGRNLFLRFNSHLQPSNAEKSPIEFQEHFDYWLELQDLLWVGLILLEYLTYLLVLPREHPYRRETAIALHKLKLLLQSITCALWYMEGIAKANLLDLNFKEIGTRVMVQIIHLP
jgi:hypothetical protein